MDWPGNLERILAALKSLAIQAERGASPHPDLILFPEMSVSGYGCEDAFLSPDLCRRSLNCTAEIAAWAAQLLPDSVVVVGLPFYAFDAVYNCSAVIENGKIAGLVPKTYLASDGVHYEPRWFRSYRENGLHYLDLSEGKVAWGRMVFEHKTVRFAIEICEDAWVATRPVHNLLAAGIDVLLNPSASHFAFDKHCLRRDIATYSSRSMGVFFLLANLLGCEAGRMIYDGHLVAALNGRLLGDSLDFSYRDFVTRTFTLNIESNRVARLSTPAYREHCSTQEQLSYPTIIKIGKESILSNDNSRQSMTQQNIARPNIARQDIVGPDIAKSEAVLKAPSIEALKKIFPVGERKEEQFLQSVCLGLFDYLRKSKSRSLVISLSGGADSAACAVISHRMLAFALHELGPEQFLERCQRSDLLAKIGKISEEFHSIWRKWKGSNSSDSGLSDSGLSDSGLSDSNLSDSSLSETKALYRQALGKLTEQLAPHFIYTLYQSTKNSSAVTRSAAHSLAEALHLSHHEIDLQNQVEHFVALAEKILKRKLTAVKDGISLQNIQARLRVPAIWLLANSTGSLLITTSNRSEAAVGYSTMDGDTAGGFAPIAGVDKAFIQRWLLFMEREGDHLLGPIAALKAVNEQRPTAELQPGQSDEEDLMPYPLLDQIERLAIRDRKSPVDILRLLCEKSAYKEKPSEEEPGQEKLSKGELSREELKQYIAHFFRLWARNQWKRERYAPSFHLDDTNLDPRSWYRFPILNGGYEEELAELEDLQEFPEAD